MESWLTILWWILWGIVIHANTKSDGICDSNYENCESCVYHLNCPQEKIK